MRGARVPFVNTTITAATYYAWGANLTLTNAGATAENVIVIINATPLKVLNQGKAIAQDATSILENGKIIFLFPANPLVQTIARAQAIANALLAGYKDPRRDLTADWRGNPALLLGDRITLTDRNGSTDYFVTRQEVECIESEVGRKEGIIMITKTDWDTADGSITDVDLNRIEGNILELKTSVCN